MRYLIFMCCDSDDYVIHFKNITKGYSVFVIVIKKF